MDEELATRVGVGVGVLVVQKVVVVTKALTLSSSMFVSSTHPTLMKRVTVDAVGVQEILKVVQSVLVEEASISLVIKELQLFCAKPR